MKGSSIISAIHHLKIAQEFMDDFIRERPTTVIARLFKDYRSKISWMFRDIKSNQHLPEIVRAGINQELNSDVLALPAINEKIALLTPQKREALELIIDELLKGEEIEVEIKSCL